MDLDAIRRLAIIAMFSDDVLLEQLVLKGGNALGIVHNLTLRSSIDLDFSIEDDFKNIDDIQARIFRALRDRFDSAGMIVFDETFQKKPEALRAGQSPRWGGYQVRFKLIEKERQAQFSGDLDRQRRNANVIGVNQERTFTIDISKYEYCVGKQATELDAFTIYVYTPQMIALEKLRAICQQMPEYNLRNHPKPRARDFFDIHTIVSKTGVELATPEYIGLIGSIFSAKEVPFELLKKIPNTRAFHEGDWDSVRFVAKTSLESFEYYFNFVVGLASRLHSLREK